MASASGRALRVACLLGSKRHAHRETIERSEINASAFLGQHTRRSFDREPVLPQNQSTGGGRRVFVALPCPLPLIENHAVRESTHVDESRL